MTSPLRIGLIGCGRIAQAAHLPALEKTDRATLVSVYDPSELLSSRVATRYGVASSATLDDLLSSDIDAVIIATPDRFHHQLGLAALNAGKHVLVEKPLASTRDEAEEMAAVATERNLRLQTGAMKRHDPGIAFAHGHLDRVGEAVSYHSVYRVPAQRAPIEATLFPAMIVDEGVREVENTFKANANRAGYLLATHGAHVFDTLLHFTGMPRWISVHAAQVGDDYTWHGTVGLASGGLGSFEMTVDVHGDWAEGIELCGTGGFIRTSTHQPFWKRASDVEVYLEEEGCSLTPHPTDTNAFKLQIEDFAAAIASGGGESPSPADGVAVVRIIDAAGASAQADGERVLL
ncbi:MAG: Gfo/Idh/MocA family oxidoreductase [Microbacterium sp.]